MKHTSLVTMLVLSILLSGCSLPTPSATPTPTDTPETGAKEWYEAIANLDGLKMDDRTCSGQKAALQQGALFSTAFYVLGQGLLGQQQVKVDVTGLQYKRVGSSNNGVDIRVSGNIRTAIGLSVQTQPIDQILHMVLEGGKWKYCGATGSPNQQARGPQSPPTIEALLDSGRTSGDPKAPIVFVVFSDFQSPYCRDFAVGVERQIKANYVKTNKVSFTFKYYPVMDQGRIGESTWAAEAAECANQQGKFWEYHDKLFAEWMGENVGTFTKVKLKQYSTDIVSDIASFNQCIDTDKTKLVIDADMADATRMGVQGTPTFFVNNRLLNLTALDYGTFSRTLDALLK